MKPLLHPLLLACIVWTVFPLAAQRPQPIQSIRIHGEILNPQGNLPLTVLKKGQDRIRATIHNRQKTAIMTLYVNRRQLRHAQQIGDDLEVRELSGSDAAAQLVDILALTPDYHFRPDGGFDMGHPTLKGFALQIRRAEALAPTDHGQPIEEISLLDISREGDQVIRTIRYLENFPQNGDGQKPRKIAFTDNTTGKIDTIIIDEYGYNVGLPDFLFEAPQLSERK